MIKISKKYFLILPLLFLGSYSCAKPKEVVQTSLTVTEVQLYTKEPKIRVLLHGRKHKRIATYSLETYLAGVIGNEMSPHWPVEALKAQTIAARSYAVYRMQEAKRNGRSWDVLPTQADQVFRLRTSRNVDLREIVKETRGEVLWKNGKVIEAFYTSTCGGKASTPIDAGLSTDSPITNLKKNNDPYCTISPFRDWDLDITVDELTEKLGEHGIVVDHLKSVKISKRNHAGYVSEVELKDSHGKQTLEAYRLRQILGNMRFKSLLFKIHQDSHTGIISFIGNGFGHGVGLCQYGAKAMAEQNKDYKEIISKYYPTMELVKIY